MIDTIALAPRIEAVEAGQRLSMAVGSVVADVPAVEGRHGARAVKVKRARGL